MANISLSEKPNYDLVLLTAEKMSAAHTTYAPKVPFTGKNKDVRFVFGTPSVLFVGFTGSDVYSFTQAIEKGIRSALAHGLTSVSIPLDSSYLPLIDAVSRATDAAALTTYVFDKYKGTTKKDMKALDRVEFVVAKKTKELEAAFSDALVTCDAANLMRDLQNTTAADLCPEDFANIARNVAKKHNLSCDVWDEKKLKQEGYNTILAVGMGSSRKPRLVTVKYTHPKAKKTICLVGKGITFDTGGYNLKPTGFMETMQFDMSGAALVLATMQAIAQLKPTVNVIGIMGMADNMVSGEAYRPSDVIKTAHGVMVEVGNTDAEGRLVLADCLHHATLHKPSAIVDFATLTGACIVALGTSTAAIMGSNEELVEELVESGAKVGERLWPLPMYDVYDQDIESKIADIKNIGYKREAGSITAGCFLRKFVDDYPWAHLDIAGVADVDRPRHFTQVGGTGWGVRSIVSWLRNLS